jgi:hypothetical protein
LVDERREQSGAPARETLHAVVCFPNTSTTFSLPQRTSTSVGSSRERRQGAPQKIKSMGTREDTLERSAVEEMSPSRRSARRGESRSAQSSRGDEQRSGRWTERERKKGASSRSVLTNRKSLAQRKRSAPTVHTRGKSSRYKLILSATVKSAHDDKFPNGSLL